MLCWRIAREGYADLSGAGGLKYSGRWHRIGWSRSLRSSSIPEFLRPAGLGNRVPSNLPTAPGRRRRVQWRHSDRRSAQAGIHRSTIANWRSSDDFREALASAHHDRAADLADLAFESPPHRPHQPEILVLHPPSRRHFHHRRSGPVAGLKNRFAATTGREACPTKYVTIVPNAGTKLDSGRPPDLRKSIPPR